MAGERTQSDVVSILHKLLMYCVTNKSLSARKTAHSSKRLKFCIWTSRRDIKGNILLFVQKLQFVVNFCRKLNWWKIFKKKKNFIVLNFNTRNKILIPVIEVHDSAQMIFEDERIRWVQAEDVVFALCELPELSSCRLLLGDLVEDGLRLVLLAFWRRRPPSLDLLDLKPKGLLGFYHRKTPRNRANYCSNHLPSTRNNPPGDRSGGHWLQRRSGSGRMSSSQNQKKFEYLQQNLLFLDLLAPVSTSSRIPRRRRSSGVAGAEWGEVGEGSTCSLGSTLPFFNLGVPEFLWSRVLEQVVFLFHLINNTYPSVLGGVLLAGVAQHLPLRPTTPDRRLLRAAVRALKQVY